MKKLFLIGTLFISLASFGQTAGYSTINARFDWLAGKFRALHIPVSNTTPVLQTGQSTAAGAMGLDTVLGRPYVYFNTTWNRIAMFSDIGSGGGYNAAEEFTGSTSLSITIAHTPLVGIKPSVYLNGVLLLNANFSISGTTLTLSGMTRETGDVVQIKYSF